MWINVIILTWWWTHLQGQDVQPLDKNSGIYYEQAGVLQLYPLKWKVISYVNVEPTLKLWQSTKKQSNVMKKFCGDYVSEVWYHHTDCTALNQYAQGKIQYITNLHNLVQEYMQNQESQSGGRRRRGVMNFVGEIFNVLFGTMSHSDAEKYNEQITKLEREQFDFLHLAKDQMTVIKSAIISVNRTITQINENEVALRKGLKQVAKEIVNITNELSKEVRMVNYINENVRYILRGLEECQHGYEILLEAFVHAAQGVMQPQLITTDRIKEVMLKNELPAGLDFPRFPLSQLQKLISPHFYSHNLYLIYVLDFPILSSKHYQLYHLTPVPILKVEQTFFFIQPQVEYIFTDSLRQQYGKMTRETLKECFCVHELLHVCKANIPLFYYKDDLTDCEAAILHPSTETMPGSCDKRLVTLDKTYWIPLLFSNDWIFSAPKVEVVATVCEQKHANLRIENTGILKLKPGCTAYTNHVTLEAMKEKESNVTTDFLPTVPINFDCCIEAEKATKLSHIVTDIPLNNLMNNMEDLKVASVKIEEVDELIKEQESKTNYSRYMLHAASWLSITGSVTLFLFCSCICCCCSRKCRKGMFWLWDHWTPRDCLKETRERLNINVFQPLPGSTLNVNTQGQIERSLSIQSLPNASMSTHQFTEEIEQETSFSKPDVRESKNEAVCARTRSKAKFVKAQLR